MRFTKGHKINVGRKLSKETKLKISNSRKGQKLSERHKKKISNSLKGKKVGYKNPAWKGGITPDTNLIRNSAKYGKWRTKVFWRDNFTCQKCKKRGRKLNAHHIRNFSSNKTQRFKIENGITFCVKCHKKFHKIYTKRNNTKKQLKEFLK